MGEHGIGDDTIVIAYDAGTIPFAARLVWMLRYYGHDEAYVLAGGFPAWVAAGYPVADRPPRDRPGDVHPRAHAELRASRDEVLAIADGSSSTRSWSKRSAIKPTRSATATSPAPCASAATCCSRTRAAAGSQIPRRSTDSSRDAGLDPAQAHRRQLRQRRLRVRRVARAARSRLRRRRRLRRLVDGVEPRRSPDGSESLDALRARR